jgi:hypothetical protein
VVAVEAVVGRSHDGTGYRPWCNTGATGQPPTGQVWTGVLAKERCW